jgi:5'-nucleotidase
MAMRILLTNDDGIDAPGMRALQQIASELSDDIWTVAPETEQSGTSHALTLHEPLRLRQVDERTYAVKGTPTDCVIMAIKHVMLKSPPNLVLSGVNRGANIADDVTYSGTVAGAMEGTVLGVPSIALSQGYRLEDDGSGGVKWQTAMQLGAPLIKKLLAAGWPEDVLININFPDRAVAAVAGVDVTRQGTRDQDTLMIVDRIDARGNPYYWFGFDRKRSNPPEGTDLWSIYNGRVSVTPLHLDLTHAATAQKLAGVLKG